ncbi:MAG: DeoR/GlpR transcriptional regulator [Gemmataceae bacterium]|nr:DeoR/GlpR transcriptional regulator [Gemmataceae bacterium]
MLVEERRQRVLDLISSKGFASLGDLSKQLGASESTLRRDLDHWHNQGVIRRTHGGAVFVADSNPLPTLEERFSRQLEEKKQIARAVSDHIRDGDTVLLDGGTTTLEVAKLLVGRPVQVVTNSIPIAQLYSGCRDTDLVLLGGYVYPRTGVALGPLTIRMLDDLHFRLMVMGVEGITDKGLFNGNLLLVETERAMMRRADELVVVADHTKIGRPGLAWLCELRDVDTLVVDPAIKPEARKTIIEAGVRLIVSGEPGGFRE